MYNNWMDKFMDIMFALILIAIVAIVSIMAYAIINGSQSKIRLEEQHWQCTSYEQKTHMLRSGNTTVPQVIDVCNVYTRKK